MLNIVLYQPEIPPNTGNIGRLCHATGTRLHLIQPLGFSLDEKSLKRAGLDYWDELDLTLWPCWDEFFSSIESLDSLHFLTTKSERPYWDVLFKRGDYLIFGPETRGLPDSLISENCDRAITIPQQRGRSLNLATSAGIVLYEGIKQLSFS